ncbi:hypothetical protein GCM10009665_34540 [Kitasatospora nipponensis]|uniref:Uncharacterized protein n=1 Tax=Kitasatospora nipponensis TaxID=258049 RepID=A0ABP4GWU7_9ACTN
MSKKAAVVTTVAVVAVAVIGGLLIAGYNWVSDRFSPPKGHGYISEDQYLAVKTGDSQQDLATRLGTPLQTADIPHVRDVPASSDSCVYYQDDVSTIDGTIYRICFKAGQVTFKDGYGPLFDQPPLGPSASASAGS